MYKDTIEIKNFIGDMSLVNEMRTCRSCWNTTNSIEWFASMKKGQGTVYTCPVCKEKHLEEI